MKSNKLLIAVIVFFGFVVLGLSGFIVYDKVLNSDKSQEDSKTANVTCDDCVNEIKSFRDSFEKKILLGGKIRTIKYVKEKENNGDCDAGVGNNQLYVDDTLIFDYSPCDVRGMYEIDIIKGDVIMLTTTGASLRTEKFYFFNSKLEEISVDMDLSLGNYSGMGVALGYKDGVDAISVNNGTISIIATRVTHGPHLVYGDNDYDVCGYDVNISKDKIAEIFNRFKGDAITAKYEIKYLGNGQFSKPKQTKVLEVLDESFCK